MEFTYLYMLVTAIYMSIFGLAAILVSGQKTIIQTAEKKGFFQTFIEKKELKIRRSRANISLKQYFLMLILCPVVLGSVFAVFMPTQPVLMICGLLVGICVPDLYVGYLQSKEEEEYSERFSKALNQMAAALVSNLSFEQSIDAVVTSELVHQTVKDDFKRLSASIKLGTPIVKAFYDYAEFTRNPDVYDVATAVSIMLQLGQKEGEGIKKIQKNIEDRILYRKKRKSMMTEAKILVYASDIIPVVVIAMLATTSRQSYLFYMESTENMLLFFGMLIWILIGSFVIHRMMIPKREVS